MTKNSDEIAKPDFLESSAKEPVIVSENIVKEFAFKHIYTLKDRLVRTLTRKRTPSGEQFRALDNVSFTINRGETIALLGFNGSGKSTILKLISGVLQPTSGIIKYKGTVAGLIEVGAGFHPDLTGRENIYLNAAILGVSKEKIDEVFDDIVSFSEIEKFIDTEVKFYSSGMFLRLAFSVCVHTDPDIFLIDEILAVGDEPFQRKCIKKIRELQENGKTMVIVSHDLNLMTELCTRGILLERGKIINDGPVEECVAIMREEN
ncbi:MAG: ABC transporter ATP-binding protein [Arcanobacterium sp.]|nr:ABC transporter ATP-binding protein [Arcanobacterium sp.]